MISCIVTTYKREPEILSKAIESIINQTYKDTEIIVVNDAPEDKSLCERIGKMLSDYNTDIKYIIHQKNSGACVARNTGIAASTGEYISFLDDDDEWMPEKLEIQFNKIVKEKAGMVYCDHYFIDADGNEIYQKPFTDYVVGNTEFERLLCFNYVGSTSIPLIKASVIKEVGGFNADLKSSQDHEVWLKIAQKSKIAYVNKPLVKYYFSEVAITRSAEKREQGYTYILNEFRDAYSKNRDVLHCRYVLLSTIYFGMHNFRFGFKYLGKAFKIKPFSLKNFSVISRTFKKIVGKFKKKT